MDALNDTDLFDQETGKTTFVVAYGYSVSIAGEESMHRVPLNQNEFTRVL